MMFFCLSSQLHEMLKPIFCEKQEKSIMDLSSAEFA